MPAVVQPFFHDRPTGMTPLRRFELTRGSLSIQDTSFCRFVPQDAEKLRWCAIQNRLVQSRLRRCPVGLILPCGSILLRLGAFRHVLHMQRFRKDGPRCGNELRRLFMMKVQTLPGDLGMHTCDPSVGQPPGTRELVLGITGTIRVFETLFIPAEEARVLYALRAAIVSDNRGKRRDAPIKRQARLAPRPLRMTSEDNRRIPLPVAIRDVARFRLSHGAGIPSDTDMPNTRQPQTAMVHALTRQQTPAIAMRGITPALKPLARLEARIAWRLACSQAPKERLKRSCHAFERVLSCLRGQWRLFLLPEHSQVTTLLSKGERGALPLPGGTTLLQGGIVQTAVGFPLGLQGRFLCGRRVQTIGGPAIDSFHNLKYNLVMENKQQLKTLYHCVYNLHFHLVIVTKYRRKCLTAAMREHLQGTFAALLGKWGGTLVECHGEADHMHLLIELPPTVLMSTCVNNLKTVSSRLLRKAYAQELARWYRKPVLWSRSYCVLSCGGAPLSVLRQYIEQQGDGAS